MLFLAGLCILGNTLFTFSSSYAMLALWPAGFRVSPRGVFGVGAIILSKIAPPGKVTAAVAGMIGGMTIANLVGVPGGTGLGITSAGAIPLRLSRYLTWRYFWRSSAGCPRFMTRASTQAARGSSVFWPPPAPVRWIFAATMFGNAGVFCLVQLYQALYAQRLRLC